MTWGSQSGIGAPTRRDQRAPSLPLWEYSKQATIWKSGRETCPDTQYASTLIVTFPASRTMKNKCLLLKPSSLWNFNYSNWLESDRICQTLTKRYEIGWTMLKAVTGGKKIELFQVYIQKNWESSMNCVFSSLVYCLSLLLLSNIQKGRNHCFTHLEPSTALVTNQPPNFAAAVAHTHGVINCMQRL